MNWKCSCCKGTGLFHTRLKNLGTREMVDAIVDCPVCHGEKDPKMVRARYLHSLGVGPCPFGNECSCNEPATAAG